MESDGEAMGLVADALKQAERQADSSRQGECVDAIAGEEDLLLLGNADRDEASRGQAASD